MISKLSLRVRNVFNRFDLSCKGWNLFAEWYKLIPSGNILYPQTIPGVILVRCLSLGRANSRSFVCPSFHVWSFQLYLALSLSPAHIKSVLSAEFAYLTTLGTCGGLLLCLPVVRWGLDWLSHLCLLNNSCDKRLFSIALMEDMIDTSSSDTTSALVLFRSPLARGKLLQ